MVIVGGVDLFLITNILAITNFYFRQSVIAIILYGMVPFNISCISYHLIVCMICITAAFLIALKQELLFETSMLWGWAVIYLLTLVFLGKTIQKYLGNEKRIGESIWSLQ